MLFCGEKSRKLKNRKVIDKINFQLGYVSILIICLGSYLIKHFHIPAAI